MPAARRWNPGGKAPHAPLIAGGKPRVSAVVACAGKSPIDANTVVAPGTPWTEAATAAACP
jgi:hypothetical protein